MDPGTEDSQGPVDPEQTTNDDQKDVGPSNSNPGSKTTQCGLGEAEEENIIETDHLDSSKDDKVNEEKHPAANSPEDSWESKLSEQ